MFAVSFVPAISAQLWDVLFVEGAEFLHKIALALLLLQQEELLRLHFDEALLLLKKRQRSDIPAAEVLKHAEKIPLQAGHLQALLQEARAAIKKHVIT